MGEEVALVRELQLFLTEVGDENAILYQSGYLKNHIRSIIAGLKYLYKLFKPGGEEESTLTPDENSEALAKVIHDGAKFIQSFNDELAVQRNKQSPWTQSKELTYRVLFFWGNSWVNLENVEKFQRTCNQAGVFVWKKPGNAPMNKRTNRLRDIFQRFGNIITMRPDPLSPNQDGPEINKEEDVSDLKYNIGMAFSRALTKSNSLDRSNDTDNFVRSLEQALEMVGQDLKGKDENERRQHMRDMQSLFRTITNVALGRYEKQTCNIGEGDVDIDFEDKLGTGTFGTVFGARYHGISVVVKRLNEMFQNNYQERQNLLKEAKTFAKLPEHPNIVQYFGTMNVRENDSYTTYLVMERCEKSLASMISPNESSDDDQPFRPLPPETIIKYTKNIVNGLVFLHGQREPIIHRDLKPGNVLLQNDVAKLADFGISVTSPGPELFTFQLRGTEMYNPPEVNHMLPARWSTSADVFALGVIVLEMVTNKQPQPLTDYDDQGKIEVDFDGALRDSKNPPETTTDPVYMDIKRFIQICVIENSHERPNSKALYDIITAIQASDRARVDELLQPYE